KDLVRTGYDAVAPAYLDFITRLPSPGITWVDKLLKLLPNACTSKVLELACGNGLPCTQHLAPKVGHITANDISAAQIHLVKERLAARHNISYISGDMSQLSFVDGTFDTVLALHSLIHLPRDEQPAMLRLAHKWLRPGGILLCNFDEEADVGTVIEDWLGTRMYKSGFGVAESEKMIVEAGFVVLEAEVVREVEGKKTVPFLWVLATK
ncbi:hypothetical protein DOTSEDRAFT_117821, partial [Dothistroma septosporum NZE10]